MEKNANIAISIICITYNHEKYIRQALDSLVSQQCSVTYEIIVHDDASTDATPNIITEYAQKYPKLVHPILQTENKYSQGIRVIPLAYEKCHGKYIALCEGDDFWNSPFKLQKQYDALEAHPTCCFCTNLVSCCKENGRPDDMTFPPATLGLDSSRIITRDQMADYLWNKKGYPFHTCSYFFPRSTMETSCKLFKEIPAITGDQIFLRSTLLTGNIFYIHEPLSVRRRFPIGGWSERQKAGGRRKDFDLALGMHSADLRFDELSERRYHKIISTHIYDNLMGFAPFYPAEVSAFFSKHKMNYLKYGATVKPLKRRMSLFIKSVLLKFSPNYLVRIYQTKDTPNEEN